MRDHALDVMELVEAVLDDQFDPHLQRRRAARRALRRAGLILLATAPGLLLLGLCHGAGMTNAVLAGALLALTLCGLWVNLHDWWRGPYPLRVDLAEGHDTLAARAWCRENLRGGWRACCVAELPRSKPFAMFTFAREQDAALFKLFWT